MKVNLQSVNFKADQKLLEFVQERMDKLDTYYDNIIGGEVFMKLDNSNSPKNKIVEVFNPESLYKLANEVLQACR